MTTCHQHGILYRLFVFMVQIIFFRLIPFQYRIFPSIVICRWWMRGSIFVWGWSYNALDGTVSWLWSLLESHDLLSVWVVLDSLHEVPHCVWPHAREVFTVNRVWLSIHRWHSLLPLNTLWREPCNDRMSFLMWLSANSINSSPTLLESRHSWLWYFSSFCFPNTNKDSLFKLAKTAFNIKDVCHHLSNGVRIAAIVRVKKPINVFFWSLFLWHFSLKLTYFPIFFQFIKFTVVKEYLWLLMNLLGLIWLLRISISLVCYYFNLSYRFGVLIWLSQFYRGGIPRGIWITLWIGTSILTMIGGVVRTHRALENKLGSQVNLTCIWSF
jgi:hypothetical protein